jgi:hypothetical protein
MVSMHEANGADEYGLPIGVLGLHPDEFYSAIGRVVCVCAVLEDKVMTLRHTLAGAEQGRFTREPVSAQIKAARALSNGLPEPGPEKINSFCDKAEAAFHHRNELVHSSFPAQPDGRLWGHRPARSKALTDGTADTVETTIGELRAFMGELASLVGVFNQVHALAGMRSPSERNLRADCRS